VGTFGIGFPCELVDRMRTYQLLTQQVFLAIVYPSITLLVVLNPAHGEQRQRQVAYFLHLFLVIERQCIQTDWFSSARRGAYVEYSWRAG
jgi:hypothetical protein